MKDVYQVISESIKRAKWMKVTYDSKAQGRDTNFWCAVKDVYPDDKKLSVDICNYNLSTDVIETTKISIDNIKEAEIVDFSFYDGSKELIQKIENNLLTYSFLKYEHFDNNILHYLLECNKLDCDPFQKNYTLVSGIDREVLESRKEIVLNEEQVKEIVSLIENYDIENHPNILGQLVLSVLSIDKRGKKYIVLYNDVCFNPLTKTLKISGNIRINPTFLIEGIRHSLSNYTELSAEELLENYKNDSISTAMELSQNLRYGEKIDTKPDFFILERNVTVNLESLFDKIEKNRYENKLCLPIKAFFGDISIRNNGQKTPNIVIYDNRVDLDQMLVLYNAMKNPVTYVQGPPGTGKTQTLFNVVVSSYFNDKTVLISTMNNKPLDGIIEKLVFKENKYIIPFPYLRLGNLQEVAKALKKIRNDYSKEYVGEVDLKKISYIKNQTANKNIGLLDKLTTYQKRKNLLEQKEFVEYLIKQAPNNKMLSTGLNEIDKELSVIPEVTEKDVLSFFEPASESPKYLQYLYFSSIGHMRELKKPKFKPLIDILAIEDETESAKEFNKWLQDDNNLKILGSKILQITYKAAHEKTINDVISLTNKDNFVTKLLAEVAFISLLP